jgi:hypothetical protein
LQLASGRFAFPSMNGVVIFHPDSIKPVLPVNSLLKSYCWTESRQTDRNFYKYLLLLKGWN